MDRADPQLLKGVLTMVLLHVVEREESYGYRVVTRLQAAGFEGLKEGTVYPALTRLERQGLLTSYLQPSVEGPARKYYRVTTAGRAELARSVVAWDQMVALVGAVMSNHQDTVEGMKQ